MCSLRNSPCGRSDVPLLFLLSLAHGLHKLAERIRSSPEPCSIEQGNPKGSGLEGRREASYAIDVPAKQKGLRSARGLCRNKGFVRRDAATTTGNIRGHY
jgi:hypothetical protein